MHNTALKNHILREVHSLNEVFKTDRKAIDWFSNELKSTDDDDNDPGENSLVKTVLGACLCVFCSLYLVRFNAFYHTSV